MMAEFDDVLDDGARISEETGSYWLNRPLSNGQREAFSIKVLRRLTGDEKGKFKALPFSSFLQGEERFYGDGKTADAALRDCLAKIKGVPSDEIFPSSEEEST